MPITRAERDRRTSRALTLRQSGMSYQAIADSEASAGLPRRTSAAVRADVIKGLESHAPSSEPREDLIAIESYRLDELTRIVQGVISSARQGQCDKCGRLENPALVLRAIDRVVRISERRAHLKALDQRPEDYAPPAADPLDEIKRRRQQKEAQGA